MTNTKIMPLTTWLRSATEETAMEPDHAYLWQHFITTIPEHNLQHAKILDYGCNRGGFLRTLYHQRPYHHGIGVDIATTSLAAARLRHADLPLTFITPEQLTEHQQSISVAFSHEVLYLLPDLAAHAAAIASTLRDDGVYYAAIGCHTSNPLWPHWRTLIANTTTIPVYDYSLDDYAKNFWQAGLQVEMRPFMINDYILIKPDNAYFPKAADSLLYHSSTKTIIRASKVRS